jgi:filamentous hemagglutinin
VTKPGKAYTFTDLHGREAIIREELGHFYGPNNPQNRGPHFNDPLGGHYDY